MVYVMKQTIKYEHILVIESLVLVWYTYIPARPLPPYLISNIYKFLIWMGGGANNLLYDSFSS